MELISIIKISMAVLLYIMQSSKDAMNFCSYSFQMAHPLMSKLLVARLPFIVLYLKTTEAAKILINSGAEVNERSFFHETPLHCAVKTNNYDLCLLLIQKGAFLNAKDIYGKNPLYDSIILGHYDLTFLLLQYGANINAKDLNELSPFEETLMDRNIFGTKILTALGVVVLLLSNQNKRYG